MMSKRRIEISEWALPLKYAGYVLLLPLTFASIDLFFAWRGGDVPYGLIAWVVFLLLAAIICDFSARRMERGPPIGPEAVGGMAFGCFGIAIALTGFAVAETTTEAFAIVAFGSVFAAIGALLIFVLDRQSHRGRGWGHDPDVEIVRRRLKPSMKRGLIAIGAVFAAMLLWMDFDDAILLAIILLVPVFICLLIFAAVKH